MKTKVLYPVAVLLFTALATTSCKKNDDEQQAQTFSYTDSTQYTYENVNYADASTIIAMHTELDAEMNKGKVPSTAVSAVKLRSMFANVNSQFVSTALNTAEFGIKEYVNLSARAYVEKFMDSLELASQSTVAGSRNIPGVCTSLDGTKKYLLSGNGFEYNQMVSKVLMSNLYYYQIASHLSATALNVDNTTIIAGQGTAMQHNWDLAFGFFGAPVNFPTVVTGLKYLSNYSNQVNPSIGSNAIMMNAFLKGRAAIIAKDYATRDAQAAIIIAEAEKILAAAIIHELNGAKTNFADDASRNHVVSEAYGFVLGLKLMDGALTDAEADAILAYFPTNLYDISLSDINNVINAISTKYGFDAVKSTL